MSSSSTKDESTSKGRAANNADLLAALSAIISRAPRAEFEALRETLFQIRSSFDPASVTMSSTNLPDAATKLSAALTESQEATQNVFAVIEEQKKLLECSEEYLAELEQVSKEGPLSSERLHIIVAKHRAINKQLRDRAHDIIIIQEHQDLSGQKIKKVLKLVHEIDSCLRSLLGHFRINLPTEPSADGKTEIDEDIDQAATNQILKDFGL